MVVNAEKWHAARTALRSAGDRFADLVESAPEPDAMATADWSIADTAAHVTLLASLCAHLLGPRSHPDPIPGAWGLFRTASVDTVADFNTVAMRQFTERDPRTLVGQLRAHTDRILETSADLDPAKPLPWLGDSRLPVIGFLAHMVNELLVHGYDIARTPGSAPGGRKARWHMPPRDAGMFWDVFLVELIRHGYGHLIDGTASGTERRIAVEFRSRYTAPFTLVVTGDRVSVEETGRDIDVHLSFDPPTFSLVMFGGRISKPRAALTGKLVVWGRRPWLLPAFLRVMHLPS